MARNQFDPTDQPDLEGMTDLEIVEAVQEGKFTINDVRKARGMEPAPAIYDELVNMARAERERQHKILGNSPYAKLLKEGPDGQEEGEEVTRNFVTRDRGEDPDHGS